MRNFEKKLETMANAGILLVVLAIVGVGAYKFLARDARPGELKRGTQLNIPGMDWAANKKTAVLVLQKGCRFCTESAPFYRKLAERLSAANGVSFAAVLPNSPDESMAYLKSINLDIRDVRQANLSAVGVNGTPTIILVNADGAVEDSWVGKLDAGEEEAVLQKISCPENEVCG